MKNLYNKNCGFIICGFILFFVMACAGQPVDVDVPQNHPANPNAQETAFIPPPNPFAVHPEMKSGAGSGMTEKKHAPAHQHNMTHEKDQMSKDSMSKPEDSKEKQDHQH